MGLDNGIRICKKNLNSSIILNESFIPSDYEVCYWRKCWGIRNDIIDYLRNTYELQEELYEYELTLADLQAIYDILLSWYNKSKVDDKIDTNEVQEAIKIISNGSEKIKDQVDNNEKGKK